MKIADNVKDTSESDDIWEQIDPKLLDDIYQGKSVDDNHFPDYSEKIVKRMVRSKISLQSKPIGKNAFLMFKRYAMKVAVIVILVGVSSLLLLKMVPETIAPTEATTTTVKATLATGGTVVIPSGTNATGGPTGKTEPHVSSIFWPIKLEEHLDFNMNNVKSINIKHYNENWENDKTVFINDPSIIKNISGLVSQITLEIAPPLAIQTSQNEVYEVAFYNKDQQPEAYEPYAFLSFRSTKDQKNYFVEGSFMLSLKLSPSDHLFQTNKNLSFESFEKMFDFLLDYAD